MVFAYSIVTRGVTLSVVLISFGGYSDVTFQIVSASSINICDALAVVSGIQSNKARIKAVVFSFSNPIVLVCFVISALSMPRGI